MTSILWNYSDTISPIFAAILLLACYVMKCQQTGFGLLLANLFISAILMGYSNHLADQYIRNTHIYHIATLLDACVVPLMLNRMSPRGSRSTLVVIPAFLAYALINMFAWEDYRSQFNSNANAILNIIISIYCFRYFIKLTQDDEILKFPKLPSFWIVSGFLFYSVVSILVVAGYKNSEWFDKQELALIWKIQQIANVIKFVLISTGIVCCYRSISHSSGLSSLAQRR